MADIPAPPVPLSQVGRAAHDIGLAGLLGGNLFGRLALHPSVTEISDKAQRGKVINAAWRRYGAINSVSLAVVLAGWAGARADEAAPSRLPPAERRGPPGQGGRGGRRGPAARPRARRAAARAGQGRARRPGGRDRGGERDRGHALRAPGP